MKNTKYVVLHHNEECLTMSQQQRDLLFSTGNVLQVKECALASLQTEFFKEVLYRPLAIILWGMADRYGIAAEKGIEVISARNWSDAYSLCQHRRPEILNVQEDGTPGVLRWTTVGELVPEMAAGG